MKRILENTWPARRARKRNGSASSSVNTTTASAPIAPFLVAPNDSTSTPRRQVTSAGRQPSAAMALAKRAPSMCTRRPYARATLDQRVELVQPVHGAALGRLGEVERGRLDPAGMADPGLAQRRAQGLGMQPAVLFGERHDLGAAGIELPCPALAVVHVADRGAVDRTVGRRDQRQRERVGRGPGRHRLHEAAGLEQLGEDVLEARGDRVGAVRRRGAGIRRLDRGEDLGRDAGDVVAAQIDRRRLDHQRLHLPSSASARPTENGGATGVKRPYATRPSARLGAAPQRRESLVPARQPRRPIRFGPSAVFG